MHTQMHMHIQARAIHTYINEPTYKKKRKRERERKFVFSF